MWGGSPDAWVWSLAKMLDDLDQDLRKVIRAPAETSLEPDQFRDQGRASDEG